MTMPDRTILRVPKVQIYRFVVYLLIASLEVKDCKTHTQYELCGGLVQKHEVDACHYKRG